MVILVYSLSLATCFFAGYYPSADSNLKAQDVDSILLDGTNKQASWRTVRPGWPLTALTGYHSGRGWAVLLLPLMLITKALHVIAESVWSVFCIHEARGLFVMLLCT